MRINGSIFDPLRPDRTTPSSTPVAPDQQQRSQDGVPSGGSQSRRSDSVQISAEGRSLASRVEADQQTTLDPERVAELRTKVLTGAYNTLDVVDQVARRILSRGDL
jgi:anti-sigma28 factor (negative regulator of flagellin synthesis)